MGSGSSQSSTTNTAPWSEQQPYLERGFQEAGRIYDQGPSQYYPGQTYTDMSNPTQEGLNAQTQTAQDGNPLIANASGYVNNTLSGHGDNPYSALLDQGVDGMTKTANGDYLTNNPYLDQMYGSASRAVKNDFTDTVLPGIASSLGTSGMAGSTTSDLLGAQAGGKLTDSLASLASDIYGGNYQQERGRQTQAQQNLTSGGIGLYGTGVNERMNAAGQAPGLRQAQFGDAAALRDAGTAYEGQAGKGLEDDINRFNYNQNADTASLQDYLAMISGNFGSTSTSRTSSKGSPIASGLGGIATLASLFG